jgi:hypothetical protein
MLFVLCAALGFVAVTILLPLATIAIISRRIIVRQLAPYQPGLTPEQQQEAEMSARAGWIGIALASLLLLRGRRR